MKKSDNQANLISIKSSRHPEEQQETVLQESRRNITKKYKMMKENMYETPEMEIIYLEIEGILCGSNEIIGENEGDW